MQETHFRQQSLPKMPTPLSSQQFFSNYPVAQSQGTAMGVQKILSVSPSGKLYRPTKPTKSLKKGVIANQKFTFATLYVPNAQQLTFLDAVLTRPADFREGFLFFGGDFVSPNLLTDTSHVFLNISPQHCRITFF